MIVFYLVRSGEATRVSAITTVRPAGPSQSKAVALPLANRATLGMRGTLPVLKGPDDPPG
jgi:hypothetical protein